MVAVDRWVDLSRILCKEVMKKVFLSSRLTVIEIHCILWRAAKCTPYCDDDEREDCVPAPMMWLIKGQATSFSYGARQARPLKMHR